jgi:predicted DNA-binding transcriptional regulator AlpA
MIEPRLLGRRDAAAAVGVGLTTFDEHVAPHLPRVKVGRRVMFRTRDLDEWIELQASSRSGR